MKPWKVIQGHTVDENKMEIRKALRRRLQAKQKKWKKQCKVWQCEDTMVLVLPRDRLRVSSIIYKQLVLQVWKIRAFHFWLWQHRKILLGNLWLHWVGIASLPTASDVSARICPQPQQSHMSIVRIKHSKKFFYWTKFTYKVCLPNSPPKTVIVRICIYCLIETVLL